MIHRHHRPGRLPARTLHALGVVLGLLSGGLPAFTAQAQTSTPPTDPASGFVACVRPSNCVDSRVTGGLAPLRYRGTADIGRALLLQTLASLPEASVEPGEGNPVRAVFTTALGFKDDVEFWIDARGAGIDFRSRSRIGLYDLGKNRSRMTEFSARFNQQVAAAGNAP